MLVVIFVLIGAILAPAPGSRGLLHRSLAAALDTLALGALIALAVLTLAATAALMVNRARGRRVAWWWALSAPTTLLCAFAILMASAGVRVAVQWDSVKGVDVRPASEASDRRRTVEAQEWSGRLTPIVVQLRGPYRADRTLAPKLARHDISPAISVAIDRQQASFARILREVRGLPRSPRAPLRRASDSLERSLELFVAGYGKVQRGLADRGSLGESAAGRHGSRRLVNAGIGKMRRARRLLHHFAARLQSLTPLFYGR